MNKKSVKLMSNVELIKEVLELRRELYKTNIKNKELTVKNKELDGEINIFKQLESRGLIKNLLRLIKSWFSK